MRKHNELSSAGGDLMKKLNLILAIAPEPLIIAWKSVLVGNDVGFIHLCTNNVMIRQDCLVL